MPEKNTDELEKILSVETLTFDGKKRKLGLAAHSGEIVGFYGLVGSGRTETAEALTGIRDCEERCFTFDGKEINN